MGADSIHGTSASRGHPEENLLRPGPIFHAMPTIAQMPNTIEDDNQISALTQNTSLTKLSQQVHQDYDKLMQLTPDERLTELAKRSKIRLQHSQQDHRQQKEDYRQRHNMPTTVTEETEVDNRMTFLW